MNKLFLSVKEARDVLGMGSTDAVYRAINRGSIPSIRNGRQILIPVADLERKFGKTEPVAAIDPEALAKAIVSEFFARLAERMTR